MSLARRALLALVLTIAFYLLALALVAALVAVPVGEWLLLHRLTPLILLSFLVLAALIVWSVVPRRPPPPPPSLRMDPSFHPRLFAELRDVAELVNEPMPIEVSLDFTVTAGVAQLGGLLGIGGRRVMVLGLPLLQILGVTELKAVIAHEYGHFLRGDTRLAPWVYRVGVTISRTLEEVGRYSDLLHLPFSLYARLFQRVTMRIRRRQELLADELAARTVGAGALIDALETTERAAIAFELYWRSEIVPVLQSGFLPPITEGFATFLGRPSTVGAVDTILSDQRQHPRDERYDSHPSVPERVRVLRSLPSRQHSTAEPAAIALLAHVPALESDLVKVLSGQRLRPVAWEDVGEWVVRPGWQRLATEIGPDLRDATSSSLPELTSNAERLGRGLARSRGADAWLSKDRATNAGLAALEAALGLALDRHGWRIESLPGLPISLWREGIAIDLHERFGAMASGRLSPLSWRQWCDELGIADLGLDPSITAPVAEDGK